MTGSSPSDFVSVAGFSLVVPTFNRANLLAAALESIRHLRLPSAWGIEVLVIDNNSTDDTKIIVLEAARKSPFPMHYILESRQGASHVRNRGIVEARFEHIVFLDDDMTEVDPGWLEAYVASWDQLAPDCVVGPVEPHFSSPPESWMTPGILKCTAEYSRKGDVPMLVATEHAHEIPGCNFAIRRSVAIEIGGFNTSLGPTKTAQIRGEDFELGERLVLMGKRVAYVPGCRIRHFISPQKMSLPGIRARWKGDGATIRLQMRVRGERLTLGQFARKFARLIKYTTQAAFCRLTSPAAEAVEWELRALFLRGLLFTSPRRASPRSLPPTPLETGR